MLASLVFVSVLTGVTAADGLVGNTLATGLACAFLAAAILGLATMTRDDALQRLTQVIKPSVCFVLIIPSLFMLMQVVPMPMGTLANAAWLSTSNALGFPVAGSITIDTGTTLIALCQYSAAAATAIAVAGVTVDRRLAEFALYLLTAMATVVSSLQIVFAGLHASPFGAVGIILSCATGIRLYEQLTHRRSRGGTRRGAAIGLAAAALSINTILLAVQADTTVLFGSFFGAAIPVSIFVIRRYYLGAWGMAGFMAAGAVVLVAFLAFADAKKDVDYAGTLGPLPTLSTGRMLADTPLLGSGAGTFESLLPIYRELDENAAARSATAATLITIEMGRLFLWGTILALLAAAAVLIRASLLRGRDHVYAGAGGGIFVLIVIIMFVSGSILDLATSLFISAAVGLAWGQSLGSGEKAIWPVKQKNGEISVALRPEGQASALRLQFGLVLAGLVLWTLAAWILSPEWYGAHADPSPFGQSKTQISIEERERLREGAAIAAVRGDLWAKSALAGAAMLLDSAKTQPANDDTRRDITNALRYAPYQSSVWLIFARLSERYGWSSPAVISLLKMAYYTGPNEADLIPGRLKVALRQNTMASDPEFQDMIGRDVDVILRRLQNLKPALAQAYTSASPDGKALVQRLVGDIDPAYLGTLRK